MAWLRGGLRGLRAVEMAMTTIAASAAEGVMVCDTRIQIEGDVWWPGEKVFRVGDALIGGAGDSAAIRKFLDWYRAGRKSLKAKWAGGEFEALVLDASGLSYWCPTLVPEPIVRGFHAIGSGGKVALGAMFEKATCERAVHVASLVDTNTGGEIQVHRLRERITE
jgi:hypothetical protein